MTMVILTSDNAVERIAEHIRNGDQQVLVIGAGSPSIIHGDLHCGRNLADLAVKVFSPVSHYPEYGHYRKDFRTGKPLRY